MKESENIFLEPDKQYDIFDYPDLQITAVGFNSCYNNDHCNLAGAIHPDCLATSSIELKKQKYQNRTFLAVWHHNINGLPYETHYMDKAILQSMIDSKFIIGFYGHQHKPEVIHEDFKVDGNKKMLVFSAGSLCAGPRELPTGELRNYNIISLDRERQKVSLHVRRMSATSFEHIVWQPEGVSQEYDLGMRKFDERSNEPTATKLLEIERLVFEEQYLKAIDQLRNYDFSNDGIRYYLLECYFQQSMHKEIIDLCSEPRSEREAIYLLNSLLEEDKIDALSSVINMKIVRDTNNMGLLELVRAGNRRLNR